MDDLPEIDASNDSSTQPKSAKMINDILDWISCNFGFQVMIFFFFSFPNFTLIGSCPGCNCRQELGCVLSIHQ